MRLEDVNDLATLDAALAKTGLSNEAKLKLKLDTILVLPQLHQPFLAWLESYVKGHRLDVVDVKTVDSLSLILDHMGLEPDLLSPTGEIEAFGASTLPTAMKLAFSLPLFQEANPQSEPKPTTMAMLYEMEQNGYFQRGDPGMLPLSDVKNKMRVLTANEIEAKLQTIEAICLQQFYQPLFMKEATRFTGLDHPVKAVNSYLETLGFNDHQLKQARFMLAQNSFLLVDLYRDAYGVMHNHDAKMPFFEFISLESVDAMFSGSQALEAHLLRHQVISLSLWLQVQFLRRVDAAVKEALPLRPKLKVYLEQLGFNSSDADHQGNLFMSTARKFGIRERKERETSYAAYVEG